MDLDPADFTPPQGRSELDEWLRVREDQIAAQLAADVRALVAPALTAWASTVTAAGDPQPLDVLNEGWRKLVVNEYGEVFAGMYQAGALSAWIAAPGEPPNGAGWADVVNDAAVTYQTTATNRIVGAADSLWNDVRYRTVLAVREGVTNEVLKDEIEAITGFVEQRADAIARTETMAAYNGGNYDGAVAMGEYGPAEKTWVATNDARTRESHAAVDNVTIPFGDTFTVGSTPMLRPHDPAAPAGEVVHCRCRLAVLYPGDTRPDGTVVGGDITGENVPDDVTPSPEVDQGVPADGFATWAEGRAYLTGRHPTVTWDDDMKKWDRRSVRDVAMWADDVAVRYPEHWAQVRYVGSRTKTITVDGIDTNLDRFAWGQEFAHASVQFAAERKTGSFIAINPRFAADYDRWNTLAQMSRQQGWLVGDTPIDTLYHEFGHIMHGSMHRLTADAINQYGAGYSMITGDIAIPVDIAAFPSFDQWFWREVVRPRAQALGSKYGSSNLVEAVAETLNATTRGIGPQQMRDFGNAWLEVGEAFRTGVIPDSYAMGAHQLDGPAAYVVNVDRILSAHGITDRPSKWPMGLSVDDAKAWLERKELP